MQKIRPCLWFDSQAEEAVNFYCSIFKNAKIDQVGRYTEEGPGPAGSVMTMIFQLEGQEFMALNGGPQFKFTEAISLAVNCETQAEIDELWNKLTADGGEESMCGWLKDKYGMSWQIVPAIIGELLQDKDPQRTQRVMHAIFQMRKIDIKTLQDAYKG